MVHERIERGNAALAQAEAESFRDWLDDNEAEALRETGLSRSSAYRAAARLTINAASRAVIRAALARRAAA